MADNNIFRIHINSKKQISNYIGIEKLLPNSQYAYKVSQSLTTEEYKDVQSELILHNYLHKRADFISNHRPSSCEPLPSITIWTLRDLQAVQDHLGKNFRVVVPPDVSKRIKGGKNRNSYKAWILR
ncbi:hypothetical protein SADUNF_Sadunf17G0089800 [Salix dunnii]|uniref:Uncharacterized protein n=1 Tax=Salix dunnii TaxID=1413687 RepID=A0A835MES9_9ROSI|nr:hypothetical protein SADUNF_Sadunf17G0089800 [Salix dunnii]